MDVLEEGHHHAWEERVVQDHPPSLPENEADRDGAADLHQRKEDGIVVDALEQRVAVPAVDLHEPMQRPSFLPEGLHGGHSRDVFVQIAVESGQDLPAFPIVLPRLLAVQVGGPHHDGQEAKPEQAQPRQSRMNIAPAIPRSISVSPRKATTPELEQLVQVLHVVDDAGHEASDRVPVEEGQIVCRKMSEELPPHVVHHALAHVLGREGVAEMAQEPQDHRGHIGQGDAIQAVEVLGGDVPVDGHLDQVRTEELGAGVAPQAQERHAHQDPVPAEIREQA